MWFPWELNLHPGVFWGLQTGTQRKKKGVKTLLEYELGFTSYYKNVLETWLCEECHVGMFEYKPDLDAATFPYMS
ncbi:MAG: hypothetical protein IJL66_02355 [Lachnospiraceae bacterium]|nr:hypothetical protein [Lachnospiraceae bacterium]